MALNEYEKRLDARQPAVLIDILSTFRDGGREGWGDQRERVGLGERKFIA